MMKLSDDLPHARWMWLKAALFLFIGVVCVVALLFEYSNWRDVFLLVLAIRAWCRLYYFCFYVIERYIDPDFKFSGLGSVVIYILREVKDPKRKHQAFRNSDTKS